MPRSSLALVLVSAAIAVVLWVMATLLESYLRTPERPPERRPDKESPEVELREEEGAEEAADAGIAGCQETENRLAQVIDQSRYCVTDDDCTLFDYGYPIDCMTAVAKSRIPLLREEYRKYDESCEHRVFFDCPTEPYVRLSVCRSNRCVVELDSLEPPPMTDAIGRQSGD